jgi:hypothetical protein
MFGVSRDGGDTAEIDGHHSCSIRGRSYQTQEMQQEAHAYAGQGCWPGLG